MTGVTGVASGRTLSRGSCAASGSGGTCIAGVAGVASSATLASASCPAGTSCVASGASWACGAARSSGARATDCASVARIRHHSGLTDPTLKSLKPFWALRTLGTSVAPRTSITSRAISSGASYAIITGLSRKTLRASNTIVTGGAHCAFKTHITLVAARSTRTVRTRSSSSAV